MIGDTSAGKTTIRQQLNNWPGHWAIRRNLQFRALGLVLLLCLSLTGRAEVEPSEYLVTQYPGIDLLIRVSAIDTSFESRVFDPEEKLLKASGVRYSSLGPIYQYIEASGTTRLLRVEIQPESESYASAVNIEMNQLKSGGPESALVAQAYQYLSLGLQSVNTSNASTWAMKANMLKRAAATFDQLGMEEMRLWSEYYAAHLVYHQLADRQTAVEFAQQVQSDAKKAGHSLVELAALQLEGEALIDARGIAKTPSDPALYELARMVLERAAIMAAANKRPVEQSRAVLNRGIAYEKQQNLERALAQYEGALEIAVDAGDAALANDIRRRAADAYESLGSDTGAIEMLEQVNEQLSEQSEVREQSQILLEKGRILINAYRWSDAVGALSAALELEQTMPTPNQAGPVGLALARAYHGMGHMDLAESALQQSIAKTQASSHARLLGEAYRMLANIYRHQDRRGLMIAARKEQEAFISNEQERAYFLFENALDALESNSGRRSEAAGLLQESARAADAAGLSSLRHRATLQLCSIRSAACQAGAMDRSFNTLLSDGVPWHAQEARRIRARLHHASGQEAQALGLMEQMIDDIRFFRSQVPGVLGAWYWENREDVLSDYMSLILRRAGSASSGFRDGKESLLALDRLRGMESGKHGKPWAESDRFRSLVGRREQALETDAALIAEIRRLQRNGKASFEQTEAPSISTARLLDRLDGGQGLLTYYFTAERVYAWLAGRDGVRLFSLTGAEEIRSALESARAGLAGGPDPASIGRLDTLGRLLVDPLHTLLPRQILFIPAGPLVGFPLDAVRTRGQYLAERHQIVNLFSIGALPYAGSQVNDSVPVRFFLAGNPELERDYFSYEQKTSVEIRSVADIFVGPGLHIVQGVALRKDEFEIDKLLQADRIHLSLPGTIDLRFPRRSQFVLSGSAGPYPSDLLQPSDLDALALRADVAVLSACAMTGSGYSSFDSQMGFVSELLRAGARSVVSSQWLVPEESRAGFMSGFHRELNSSRDVALALYERKRRSIASSSGNDAHQWAAFQLYVQ
jgi:tetratricopeptide (TPR) repeat protein